MGISVVLGDGKEDQQSSVRDWSGNPKKFGEISVAFSKVSTYQQQGGIRDQQTLKTRRELT